MTKRKRPEQTSPTPPAAPAPLPPPSAAEQAAIAAARARVGERTPRFRLKVKIGEPGTADQIGSLHNDTAGWYRRLQDAFGTHGDAFAFSEMNRLVRASTTKGKLDGVRLDSLVAVVDGARPSNEIEAMLASQIAVTHNLAMELLQRAKSAEQIPQFDAAGRLAAKLLVAFAGHVELLAKLKRGGNQTVRVEHVHVHPGGQAIVGNVATGGRGGGEMEHQPHAPQPATERQPRSLANAPGAQMPRLDPIGEPLPVSSSPGEGAMPDARRGKG